MGSECVLVPKLGNLFPPIRLGSELALPGGLGSTSLFVSSTTPLPLESTRDHGYTITASSGTAMHRLPSKPCFQQLQRSSNHSSGLRDRSKESLHQLK